MLPVSITFAVATVDDTVVSIAVVGFCLDWRSDPDVPNLFIRPAPEIVPHELSTVALEIPPMLQTDNVPTFTLAVVDLGLSPCIRHGVATRDPL